MPIANDQFKLENVRLSFPDIWKPKSVKKDDKPKYAASFLIDKKIQEDQLTKLKAAIWGAAKAEWGEKAKEMFQAKGKGKILVCLHEGSDKEYDGYNEDNMYISASSERRPMIRDRDLTPLAEDDRRPYAGCYVNAIIRIWCQHNEWGNRVNAELMGVQFYADGEPFGAAPLADDAFENLDEKEGKTTGKGKKGKTEEPPEGGDDEDEIPF